MIHPEVVLVAIGGGWPVPGIAGRVEPVPSPEIIRRRHQVEQILHSSTGICCRMTRIKGKNINGLKIAGGSEGLTGFPLRSTVGTAASALSFKTPGKYLKVPWRAEAVYVVEVILVLSTRRCAS